ncbi:hypothetical protein OJF2_18450 [Aquisphaera giovannonii]|uniref:LysM domain/BON superfamily protein n=2 Tax=Aquisphaera giovannonii TaxID=406548 RepID=A0A5B9VZH6_9BACT|nr:hypothetical protein OJF2_18450 [Aquisphaera giovannonii]
MILSVLIVAFFSVLLYEREKTEAGAAARPVRSARPVSPIPAPPSTQETVAGETGIDRGTADPHQSSPVSADRGTNATAATEPSKPAAAAEVQAAASTMPSAPTTPPVGTHAAEDAGEAARIRESRPAPRPAPEPIEVRPSPQPPPAQDPPAATPGPAPEPLPAPAGKPSATAVTKPAEKPAREASPAAADRPPATPTQAPAEVPNPPQAPGAAKPDAAPSVTGPAARPKPPTEPRSAFTTVAEGEGLGDVAARVYGGAEQIELLWRANRDLLPSRDSPLKTGSILRTPDP